MEETKTEPGQPDAAADATACDWSSVGYRWGLLFLVMGGGFFVGATLLATGARRAASNGDGRRGPSYNDATCDLLSVDAQKTQTSRGCYDVFRYAFRGTGEATRHFDAASVLNCTASTCDECATNTRSPVAGRGGDVVPCFRQKDAPHDCEDCFALVARPDPIWLEARYRPWTQFAVAGGALLVVSVSAACLLACAPSCCRHCCHGPRQLARASQGESQGEPRRGRWGQLPRYAYACVRPAPPTQVPVPSRAAAALAAAPVSLR